MHTVAITDNQPRHNINRALAQLDELEAMVPDLQHRTLVMEAWLEFLERGKRLDS